MHARFFVDQSSFLGNRVLITDKDLIYQITKVLRLKIGDQIILLDNSGFEYLVNLEKISAQGAAPAIASEAVGRGSASGGDHKIEGYIIEKNRNRNEPEKKIILCQSLLKSDKFEQVLKFCTNLGISDFIPFASENSMVKEISPHKLDRYQKIIKESAEQSYRAILPPLEKLMSFKELLAFLKDKRSLKLIGWEHEKEKNLADFAKQIRKAEEIYLLIGPEGGFSEKEIILAKKANCLSFSLGKLILRSEIAGLVASTLILN